MQSYHFPFPCNWRMNHYTDLGVDYDLHVHCLLFLQPLDSSQRDPQVVSIEDLELWNRFKFVYVGLGNLGNLQQTQFSFILDQRATLKIRVAFLQHELSDWEMYHSPLWQKCSFRLCNDWVIDIFHSVKRKLFTFLENRLFALVMFYVYKQVYMCV